MAGAARRGATVTSTLALLPDLGGEAAVFEVRQHLARRASALITSAEVEESKLVLEKPGTPFDPALSATAVNSLRRLLLDLA